MPGIANSEHDAIPAVFLLVFGLALSTTLLLVPLADWLGRRFNITAKFGGRRQSEADARRVSKLGGIALYGGFVMAVLAAQLLPVPRLDGYEIIRLTGLLLGGTVIFVVGLLDDIFDLPPLAQFVGQFARRGDCHPLSNLHRIFQQSADRAADCRPGPLS